MSAVSVADLLREAAETHHRVYRITDGHGPGLGLLVRRLADRTLRAAHAARRRACPQ